MSKDYSKRTSADLKNEFLNFTERQRLSSIVKVFRMRWDRVSVRLQSFRSMRLGRSRPTRGRHHAFDHCRYVTSLLLNKKTTQKCASKRGEGGVDE